MKKILIINTTFDQGGAARVARGLFDGLSFDFEMHFAYGRGRRLSGDKLFYFGNPFEKFLQIFMVRFFGLEGFGSYFSTKKLIKHIKRGQFDLINLHNLHGYYLNFFSLIKFIKQANIPVVWSLHDEWPITWLPAHSQGCEHCKTGKGKCANSYGYPKNYLPIFQKLMLRLKKVAFGSGWSPVVVSPSLWLADNLKKSFLGSFEIKIINNGVNTEIFKPALNKQELRLKHNLPLDKKIIIFSATNLDDSNKGAASIILAAELCQAKEYLFLGIGNGKINNSDNLRTVGYIHDQKKYAEMLAAADLYCLTSSAETFSLAAAEALASSVPVVGFGIPVIKELIDENTGSLVELNDVASLAAAIDRLLEDEVLRSRMGENGRRLILNSYSREAFNNGYMNLFQHLLK